MSVTVAKSAGFCFGVSRAVDTVEQAAAQGGNVATLGPIIHNRHVVQRFESLGVRVISAPEEASEDMTVIIRSHGVAKDVLQRLEATGAQVIDATCPFVKRIHDIVSNAEQEGRLPVIIGTRSHPEVEGIAGWCGVCRIFESPQEVDEWAMSGQIPADHPISMVCQTTSTESLWKNSVKIVKNSLLM
jgi:4-hydroxy-3-methylbut-2-enyl diphosphate reductase